MLYVYVEPVSAVMIAAVLLGESLTLLQGLGAALTFVALWIAPRRGRGPHVASTRGRGRPGSGGGRR